MEFINSFRVSVCTSALILLIITTQKQISEMTVKNHKVETNAVPSLFQLNPKVRERVGLGLSQEHCLKY